MTKSRQQGAGFGRRVRWRDLPTTRDVEGYVDDKPAKPKRPAPSMPKLQWIKRADDKLAGLLKKPEHRD